MINEQSKEYKEGYESGANGNSIAFCPYGEFYARERANWLQGWSDSENLLAHIALSPEAIGIILDELEYQSKCLEKARIQLESLGRRVAKAHNSFEYACNLNDSDVQGLNELIRDIQKALRQE